MNLNEPNQILAGRLEELFDMYFGLDSLSQDQIYQNYNLTSDENKRRMQHTTGAKDSFTESVVKRREWVKIS